MQHATSMSLTPAFNRLPKEPDFLSSRKARRLSNVVIFEDDSSFIHKTDVQDSAASNRVALQSRNLRLDTLHEHEDAAIPIARPGRRYISTTGFVDSQKGLTNHGKHNRTSTLSTQSGTAGAVKSSISRSATAAALVAPSSRRARRQSFLEPPRKRKPLGCLAPVAANAVLGDIAGDPTGKENSNRQGAHAALRTAEIKHTSTKFNDCQLGFAKLQTLAASRDLTFPKTKSSASMTSNTSIKTVLIVPSKQSVSVQPVTAAPASAKNVPPPQALNPITTCYVLAAAIDMRICLTQPCTLSVPPCLSFEGIPLPEMREMLLLLALVAARVVKLFHELQAIMTIQRFWRRRRQRIDIKIKLESLLAGQRCELVRK